MISDTLLGNIPSRTRRGLVRIATTLWLDGPGFES